MARLATVAVTNTSPLIALASVGQLDLLAEFFDQLVVPDEVWDELVGLPSAREPEILLSLPNVDFRSPSQPIPPATESLDIGERHAIALAAEAPGAVVLLDERQARHIAAGMGLRVAGTLRMLIQAHACGRIPLLAPLLTTLAEAGFRMSPSLIARALHEVGEGP